MIPSTNHMTCKFIINLKFMTIGYIHCVVVQAFSKQVSHVLTICVVTVYVNILLALYATVTVAITASSIA